MAYEVLDNFVRGLDVRRPVYAVKPGGVFVLTDAHVTRGGTIEQRKAFVSKYAAVGTKGLSKLNGEPCVFGEATRPIALDANVEYQQLDPGDASTLVQVDSVELFDGLLYVSASFSDGDQLHFYDGTLVDDWFDGRSRTSFDITGGTAGGGNEVGSVKANGVEILNVAVAWATSHAATAEAVAAQINAYASTPEYTALAVGATVVVIAPSSLGDTANGYSLLVDPNGTVTTSTPANFAGGFPIGDTFTPGTFVKTFGSKLYAVSGSLAHSSGIDGPTGWNYEENDGAMAVNLSNAAGGSEELKSMENFLGRLAIFAKGAIQIWDMFADPLENALVQTILEYGTVASRSVKQHTESDVFFLDNEMIRALNPSGTLADYAVVRDPAAPVAKLVRTQVRATAAATVARAFAVIEPVERRLWMAIGDQIFVFTRFEEEKIRAWSVYEPGFTPTDAVTIDEALWVRGDDNELYLYGDTDNDTYDSTVPIVVVPVAYQGTPATNKTLSAIDVGLSGEWKITLYENPDEYDLSEGQVVWQGDGPTWWKPDNGVEGLTTHAVLKIEGVGEGYKELVNIGVHYEPDDAP